MTEIYRFINESDVDIVDDYTHEAEIFEYEEVMFRTNKVTDATNISSSLWYTLIATYKEKIINPVYLFYDYESVTGTGHSFDLMFYLLYMFFEKNVKAKFLIHHQTMYT